MGFLKCPGAGAAGRRERWGGGKRRNNTFSVGPQTPLILEGTRGRTTKRKRRKRMEWLPSSSSPLTRLSVGGVGPTGTKKRAETFSSSNYHEQGFLKV